MSPALLHVDGRRIPAAFDIAHSQVGGTLRSCGQLGRSHLDDAPLSQCRTYVRASWRVDALSGGMMSGTKLNAIALYGNFIVMALLGLVISPFLVQHLGPASFGIWKSCQRIFDLSSAADGRATQALKWVIAHQTHLADDAKRQRDIGASFVIWLMWLPILLVAVSMLVYLLPWFLNGLTSDQVAMTRWVGAILGANVILSAVLNVPDAVLFGTNQAYRSVVLTTWFVVVANVGMLVAAWLGYDLPTLAGITLACAFLNGVSTWLVARRKVQWWGIRMPQRADISRLLRFSNWTLGWVLVQTLLLSAEVFLIGFLIDPVTVTRYNFVSFVIQFALSICLMTGSAVTPRLGALIGAGDARAARSIICRTRDLLIAAITVSGSAIILLNRGFVSTWIGPEYYLGDAVNALMVITFLQLALVRFDAQVQDVGLQIRSKVLFGLAGAIGSLLLAAVSYLISRSLAGLLVGLVIGRAPLSLLLPRLVVEMVPGAHYDYRSICAMLAIVGGSIPVSQLIQPNGWLELLAFSLIVILVVSALSYVFVLAQETRLSLQRAIIAQFARSRH